MPLIGLDWRINKRNILYGLLPGSLSYEHTINKNFYYGANLRAVTNSYAVANQYWRINENQFGLYLDTYMNKNFVFNIEAGHSAFRKIETGIKHIYKYNSNVKDNFYLSVSFGYRVRFLNPS